MLYAAQRLLVDAALRFREALYFYRRQLLALAVITGPVLLPACLLAQYRFWVVLGGDPQKFERDALASVAMILANLFVMSSTILRSVAVLEERDPPPAEIRRAALLAMPGLMLVQIVVGFAIIGGLFMLVLPGLWLLGCLTPAMVLVVAERLPVIQSVMSCVDRFRPLAIQLLVAILLCITVLLLFRLGLAALELLSYHLPLWPRVACWSLLEVVGMLSLQLMPVLMVRYYDLQRREAA